MEKLAVHAGDVDGRVSVMARDLSHAYDFLQIAEVLADAGRSDDALEWAQRGLIAFVDDPHGPDSRLDDFVLGAYLVQGRHDEVVELVWERFEKRPSTAARSRCGWRWPGHGRSSNRSPPSWSTSARSRT
ncbi:MAG TPA: hypothetical protein VM142_13330 [Acidimicrobiales bacterium]|nr:hypothetical protein [Acidimicrobiales bacterium]